MSNFRAQNEEETQHELFMWQVSLQKKEIFVHKENKSVIFGGIRQSTMCGLKKLFLPDYQKDGAVFIYF